MDTDSAQPGPSGSQAQGPAAPDATRHPSGIVPTLQNVVATVNLGCKLDLKQIAMQARNAEYNPKVKHISGWYLRNGVVSGLKDATSESLCRGAQLQP